MTTPMINNKYGFFFSFSSITTKVLFNRTIAMSMQLRNLTLTLALHCRGNLVLIAYGRRTQGRSRRISPVHGFQLHFTL